MKNLLQHCEGEHNTDLGRHIATCNLLWCHVRTSSGAKTLTLNSIIEFEAWKEKEEEATYTTYVKSQKSYVPKGASN